MPRDLAAESPFGKWTALQRIGGNPCRWFCRCECGTERAVLQTNLTRGLSCSCGCSHAVPVSSCPTCGDPVFQKCLTASSHGRQRFCSLACFRWSQHTDLIGTSHGILTVIRCAGLPVTGRGGGRTYLWICRCECGIFGMVRGGNLRGTKGTLSCGCRKRSVGFAAIPRYPKPVECVCAICSTVTVGHPNRRYCSAVCARADDNKPISVVNCPICATPVQRRGAETNLYCSDICYRIADGNRKSNLGVIENQITSISQKLCVLMANSNETTPKQAEVNHDDTHQTT